jgi:hypothetical protein
LLGKVTAFVLMFAHSKYPFSAVLVAMYLLTAIAEPLNKSEPINKPIKNLPRPDILEFITGD